MIGVHHLLRKTACILILAGLVELTSIPSAAITRDRLLTQCRLSTWNDSNGLPGLPIQAIAQTNDGYLWMGCQDGLWRFNGEKFQQITSKDIAGLPNVSVTALYSSKNGILWVGTERAGFGYIADNRFHQVSPLDNDWNVTNSITQTSDGSIWFGCQFKKGNLYRYYQKKLVKYTDRMASVKTIVEWPRNTIVCLDISYAIYTLNINNANSRWVDLFPVTHHFTCMIKDKDGALWIGSTNEGIFRFKNNKLTHINGPAGLNNNKINVIYQDKKGVIWVGSNNGLYGWDGTKFQYFSRMNGLYASDVRSFLEDREGSLWVAVGAGLNQFTATKVIPVDFGNHDAIINIKPYKGICLSKFGGVWAATSSGIYKINGNQSTRFINIPGINSNFDSIDENKNGDLWLVKNVPGNTTKICFIPKQYVKPYSERIKPEREDAQARLTRIKPEWEDAQARLTRIKPEWEDAQARLTRIKPEREDAQARLTRIKPEREDVKDFAAYPGIKSYTLNNTTYSTCFADDIGLLVFSNNRVTYIKNNKLIPKDIDSGWVFTAVKDSSGNIWVGCEQGIVLLNHKTAKVMPGLPPLTHVVGIAVGRNVNELWLASNFGLIHYDNGNITIYNVMSGLPSQYVYEPILDNKGRLWLTTHQGIFYINLNDIKKYDRKELKKISYVMYGYRDGVRSLPISNDTAKDNGLLYFDGDSGVSMIDTNTVHQDLDLPSVVIESASLDSTKLEINSYTKVPAGSGLLNIHYTALNYTSPEKMRFKYRLEGFDDIWHDAVNRRYVTYTNLPPGRYTFRVVAFNGDNLWTPNGAILQFELEPYYYQTIWFKLMIAFLLLVVIGLVFHYRMLQALRRNRELENKVAERTKELVTYNYDLTVAKKELESRNDDLMSMQVELETQNEELVQTQYTLAQANAQLAELATTDGLTGLKNHRAFYECLEKEWDRWKRTSTPFSLIMLDVDRFKQFNDTYGHPAGDQVLKQIARILKEQAREYDFVARYGGEEFVIITPETKKEDAIAIAERLRSAIEHANWGLAPVTSSFGVASVNLRVQSLDKFIDSADEALYQAKQSGRNMVRYALQYTKR